MFEALFDAHSKRKAVQRCTTMKDAMIAGIWGNSNYDSQKEGQEGARRELLEHIETQYRNALTEIYTGKAVSDEAEINWNDPFWAAMNVPKMEGAAGAVREDDDDPETSAEKRRLLKEIDQA